jgi:hypothetical protein
MSQLSRRNLVSSAAALPALALTALAASTTVVPSSSIDQDSELFSLIDHA